jgi:ribose/xylose/arabinose/galactoside ABC-type transport system permease subunit
MERAGATASQPDGLAAPAPEAGGTADWVPAAIVYGLVAAATIAVAATTPNFLTSSNFEAILRNTAIVGIVAVAMTPITLSGNFVSLGISQSAMAGMLGFIYLIAQGWSQPVAMLAVLAGLVVIGIAQGLIVSAGLNPVLTTLAAGAIIFGVVAELTGGRVIRMGDRSVGWGNDEVLGVPLEVVVFAVVTIAVTLLVTKTVIGRHTVLTGANRESAEISGISFRGVTIVAFVIFSLGLAIAGILNAAGFGQGEINSLSTLTIDSIAALLVGGVAIAGGEGSPLRSAGGALLIGVISNVMVLKDFSTGGRLAVQGGVVVVVVVLLELLRRRAAVR